MSAEEPAESPAPRKPRVKKEPVSEKPSSPRTGEEVVDPMFLAGLTETVKKMVQADRHHRISMLKIV